MSAQLKDSFARKGASTSAVSGPRTRDWTPILVLSTDGAEAAAPDRSVREMVQAADTMLAWARRRGLPVAHLRRAAYAAPRSQWGARLRPLPHEAVCDHEGPSFYSCELFGRLLDSLSGDPVLIVVGPGAPAALCATESDAHAFGHEVIFVPGRTEDDDEAAGRPEPPP